MVQYTLEANREGCVGMAANMIGVKKRVIIVNMGLVDLVMFNPVLLKADMSAWAGSFGRNYYLNQRDSKKAILPVIIGYQEIRKEMVMGELTSYNEQFEKIVNIIESAKERAYRKVNEELILMYRDVG